MNHDASHPFHDPIRLHAFQSDFPTNVPELYDHFHPFEQEDRAHKYSLLHPQQWQNVLGQSTKSPSLPVHIRILHDHLIHSINEYKDILHNFEPMSQRAHGMHDPAWQNIQSTYGKLKRALSDLGEIHTYCDNVLYDDILKCPSEDSMNKQLHLKPTKNRLYHIPKPAIHENIWHTLIQVLGMCMGSQSELKQSVFRHRALHYRHNHKQNALSGT